MIGRGISCEQRGQMVLELTEIWSGDKEDPLEQLVKISARSKYGSLVN